ncbi:hypothetical protein AMJ52_05765 [candidate division TA06 bacterium DG_78]|uniref:Glycosyl transferase family 1 domain-containing protein n=1 Tax=candidate division TA06 bacterium DG_78 TaxID=1703772 RepID=A0A0S7YDB1_UNCT6|nr:MAG: hypothetical protein AMJ52_05765 [candidate division TA06 bacterium DG_78]
MRRRLKVVHITSMPGIGGLSQASYTLINAQLKDSELKVGLLTLSPQSNKQKELENLGCEVLSIPLKNGLDLSYLHPTIEFLKKYEIHHFHILIPPFLIASVLCRQKYRIYTNRGAYAMQRPKIKKPFYAFFLKYFFAAFTGNTKYAALVASNRFKIPFEYFSIVYNGLDFSTIKPQYTKARLRRTLKLNDNLVIGTVSLLHKGKYIERLLNAASRLQNLSFRLLIVGDGPARHDLIHETKKLGIDDRVIFTGMQVPPYDFIETMDIFIFPSASQSFGNVLIEAMSLGTPVIVFADSGGLLEHIQHGKTGFIVKDEKDLATYIQKLSTDKHLRNKVGKVASSFVRKKYTLAQMTEGYKKIYASVFNKPTLT